MEALGTGYGVHLSFEVKTDTRDFASVDAAMVKAGIVEKNRPSKPNITSAIARAMAYLTRTCTATIEFPPWSKHNQWEGKRANEVRNPNFSFKITPVKKLQSDTSQAWRVNIADNTRRQENLGHVISIIHDPNLPVPVYFTHGTDREAFEGFGREVQEIVNTEYARFINNYNDEDLRSVFNAELTEMRALKIIKNTNCFIPRDFVQRAEKLYTFAQECGQTVSWLGLDDSVRTRDSLLADLKAVIFGDMEEYEAVLDEKLNAKEGERKRGEKQRERMYNTSVSTIDRIMAQAEYHAAVLGVMADGIREKESALRLKACEFLTKDFSTPEVVAPIIRTPQLQTVAETPESVF